MESHVHVTNEWKGIVDSYIPKLFFYFTTVTEIRSAEFHACYISFCRPTATNDRRHCTRNYEITPLLARFVKFAIGSLTLQTDLLAISEWTNLSTLFNPVRQILLRFTVFEKYFRKNFEKRFSFFFIF